MAGIVDALFLALVVTVTPPKKAEDGKPVTGAQVFRGDYSVSFLGLAVAKTSFQTTIKDGHFSISGSASSTGLAEIFDPTSGSIRANGRFSGGATRPDAYQVDYVMGKKAKSTRISFAGGNVAKTVNQPPLRKKPNWVPVTKANLNAVMDPISASLIRAESLGEVCGRTVKVYDGEMRADLQLGPGSTQPINMAGYKGEAITCTAKFVPVAGYRAGHRSIEYLKNRARITIMFAPLGQTGIYAPIRATVSTQIGPITVQARRFEAL